MIKVQDWIASIPDEEKHVAYVGEGKSVEKEFLLCGDGWEHYTEWTFYLDMAFDLESITKRDTREVVATTVDSWEMTEEGAVTTQETVTKESYTVHNEDMPDYYREDIAPLIKRVDKDGIHLTWTVLRQHTVLPGKLWATLRAVSGEIDEVKKSAIMVFEVDNAICALPAATPPISEMEQIRQQAAAAKDAATAASDGANAAANRAYQAAADALNCRFECENRAELMTQKWEETAAYAQTAQQAQEKAAAYARAADQSQNVAAAHNNAANEQAVSASLAADAAAQAANAAAASAAKAEDAAAAAEEARKAAVEAGITVDGELNTESANPVENRVVAREISRLFAGAETTQITAQNALDTANAAGRIAQTTRDKVDYTVIPRLDALEQNGTAGGESGVVVRTPSYAFAIADKEGRVAFAVDESGKVTYVGQSNKPSKENGNYDAEINMFICYGQSWSTGYDASAITTESRYDNLMLDTGIKNEPLANLTAVATSFVPAVEVTGWSSDAHNQKVGETPVTAQMHIVKQLMESEDGLTVNDISYQLLGTAPGMGSKTLAQLEKGTDYYARLIAQVQQAYDIAAAMGKRLVVQAFSWVQGSLGRTGDYAEALEQLRLDIDTDVKAITGQTQDVKCITWQSFIYNTTLRAKQVYDQYVGAADTYPNIICAGATYHLDNVRAANLHFTSESQDWLGAYFGVAYKRAIIDGEDFEPLKPTKASKSGKILYVKFNVPQRPLVFDTERLTEAPNKGFKLYATDGTEKAITEVAIVSPDTVKIVCADDVAGTDRLTYGEITADTYQWVSDNHGNLRDSQGEHIRYESGAGNLLPLHNWCVIFDKTITELEG